MTTYRKHLSGEAAFRSFVPTPLSEIQVIHTEELDKLIMEVESAMQQFNDNASQLSDEQVRRLMQQEAENSCQLALGEQPLFFGFMTNTNNALEEDTNNLLKATSYAIEAMDELPLSARLLRNAHYLMCNSERYEKKYPDEFRTSPVWIGRKGNSLKDAIFVPPVYDDMIAAFSNLERYINYEDSENIFVRAALIHYQFEMIHPFIDGNGRVGRLLNTLYLIEQNVLKSPILQLSDALKRRILEYYMGLQYVNDTQEYNDWLRFYLTTLKLASSINNL